MCETSPSAPMAAPTDVRPSSSGTDAATSAPNASTRIRSVIGIEISSARCSPLLTSWVIALSSEPLPASLKVTPCLCAASWLTKCCTSAARLSGLLGSPRSVTTTSAVRPPARDSSGERSGPSTDFTAGRRRAPASSAATACAVRCGLLERTSTFSVAGPWRPEAESRASARADSPVPEPEFESVRMPSLEPSATHATISVSQSATVVFGRRAALRAAAWTKRASTPEAAEPPGPGDPPEPADPPEPPDPPEPADPPSEMGDEGVISMDRRLPSSAPKIAGAIGRLAACGPPSSMVGKTPPATDPQGVGGRLERRAPGGWGQVLRGDSRAGSPVCRRIAPSLRPAGRTVPKPPAEPDNWRDRRRPWQTVHVGHG